MKNYTSKVTTTASSFVTGKNLQKLARAKVEQVRKSSVPEVALVNNFDVDQRGFLTDTMQGFTMVQKGAGVGTYGTLAAQADYSTPAATGPTVNGQGQKVRPVPGQPALVYPVAAQSGSFNTSFLHGGGTDPKRYYPVVLLTGGGFGSTVLDT